jgi:hypothetical protein
MISKDTSPHIAKVYHEKIMALSGEERMMMGIEMRRTARDMVLASLPPELSETEKKVQLFLRFYGNDFSDEWKEKFIRHLRSQSE